MKSLRPVLPLLALAALLAVVFLVQSRGVDLFVDQLGALSQEPGALTITEEEEAEQLARARGLPTVARIDLLLQLMGQGSEKAEGQLELWLQSGYPAGTLTGPQRRLLEQIARRSESSRQRRGAAGILLADSHRLKAPDHVAGWAALPTESQRSAAWALGLWSLRGEAPEGSLAWLEQRAASDDLGLRVAAWRAMGSVGAAAIRPMLDGLAKTSAAPELDELVEGLLDLAAQTPASRMQVTPRCIELLGSATAGPARRAAALRYLRELSGRDWGPDPGAWQEWWTRTLELQRKYAGE